MQVQMPQRPGPHGTAVIHAPDRAPAQQADDCAIVIFGAFGDLTKRLVMPALYNLARTRILPENFAIIGVDVVEGTAESWANHLHEMLLSFVGNANSEFNIDAIDEALWGSLSARMSYVQGDITKPEVYEALAAELETASAKYDTVGNAIFYLAVGDRFFGDVVDRLGGAGLADQQRDETGAAKRWRRVVIEKPFGHDLASAVALNARILRSLHEDQIFRIDHFLGKETVQAIMAFRFANGLFEPLWNRDRIDHVQITAAETVGVEARGAFYEVTGAMRDMVPNHVFSLLAMVAMEPPATFDAAGIRNRKAEVFAAMPPLPADAVVRGQYGAGAVSGVAAVPYRTEPHVDPRSNTETYVALRVEIDNWRWAGVPFYLRTGKHMASRMTEIAIRFKPAPLAPFATTAVDETRPNWLVIRIQPKEGISLQFDIKRPGPSFQLGTVQMNFAYADWFLKEPNIGYETLIHDVMVGDATLFNRADMVEAAWRVVQPALDAWTTDKSAPQIYPSGSAGPTDANALLAADGGRAWREV
ncbi:MAG: glucose-6-phosphate 1-dehydrogenase [Rhodospirillales bacterium]|nr:glucose-6-phosphate 1-dehydrogenase [Rhodospirillales bacterium]